MISLEVNTIPKFLHSGFFYESLDERDDRNEIQIPEDCFVDTDEVHDSKNFARLIKVTAFWGLYKIPLSLIAFCHEQQYEIWSSVLASESEDLEFVQVLKSIFHSTAPLVTAIDLGNTEAVEYLVTKYNGGLLAAAAAAEHGRLDFLILLHKFGHPWNETVCENAAAKGHLDCLQYLHENDCPWDNALYLSAVASGHLNCIQYAFEQGLKWHEQTAEVTAASGNLEILKYIEEKGGEVNKKITMTAARHGHTDCLQYLLQVNCPVEYDAGVMASWKGHLECLKLLHRHMGNDWWDVKITSSAAIGGQLDCLQYLHEHGCPWDVRTTTCAACRAYLDCLRYAMDNQCAFDSDILLRAVRPVSPDSVQCLRYLIEECALPLSAEGTEFEEAFLHGNYYAMQYLIDLGCPYLSCAIEAEKLDSALVVATMLDDDTHEFDVNLVKCMACAISNNWNLARNGAGLRSFVKIEANKLPLSAAFLYNYKYTLYETVFLTVACVSCTR